MPKWLGDSTALYVLDALKMVDLGLAIPSHLATKKGNLISLLVGISSEECPIGILDLFLDLSFQVAAWTILISLANVETKEVPSQTNAALGHLQTSQRSSSPSKGNWAT